VNMRFYFQIIGTSLFPEGKLIWVEFIGVKLSGQIK